MNGGWYCLGIGVLCIGLVAWLLHVGKRACEADWNNRVINSLDGLNRLFCKSFHRFEFEPIVVPGNGGAIVASNHVSGLDPLLLGCAINRPLRYMIATEQYNRPILHWMYKAMGCIPVDRTGSPEKAFYAARQALQAGELICVFPEGRITLPDESVPLKRGVVLLADMSGVSIIPVRLSGISGIGRVLTAIFMRSSARLELGTSFRVDGPRDKSALGKLKTFFEGAHNPQRPRI